MNCDQCQQELSAWLDGEVSPERGRTIEAHVHSCAPCHAAWTDERALRAELASAFQELRHSAPLPPALSKPLLPNPLALVARSRWPRVTAAAAVLLLFGLGWVLLPQLHGTLDPGELSRSERRALLAEAPSAFQDLAMTQEFQVRLTAPDGPRLFHFAHRGSDEFLWQRIDPAAPKAAFDPTRYLTGSDGKQLWVLAPSVKIAQRFDLGADSQVLALSLARALTELARAEWDDEELMLEADGEDAVWVRTHFQTGEGTITATLRLARAGDQTRFLRLQLPGQSALQLDPRYDGDSFAFTLAGNRLPDMDIASIDLRAEPGPDAGLLHQLGYLPGATLPPGALPFPDSGLQSLGYAGYL